jgi:hypothetical protein
MICYNLPKMSLIHGKEEEYYLLMAHQIIKCIMTCNSERVYYFSILIDERKRSKVHTQGLRDTMNCRQHSLHIIRYLHVHAYFYWVPTKQKCIWLLICVIS